jgi:hypothetical protein
MEFVHSRTELQLQALEKAREEFFRYHTEVQGLLIAYIAVDQALLDTQTKKEIAVQQQAQYVQEAAAQEQRIAVAEKTARAEKQTDVIAAKLSIDIATDKAQAVRMEAAGIRDATMAKADGTAYQNQQESEGLAKAYLAQQEVLGKDNIAILKVFEQIASGQIVITPQIQVSGGDGSTQGNLFNVWLAKMLKDQEATTTKKS